MQLPHQTLNTKDEKLTKYVTVGPAECGFCCNPVAQQDNDPCDEMPNNSLGPNPSALNSAGIQVEPSLDWFFRLCKDLSKRLNTSFFHCITAGGGRLTSKYFTSEVICFVDHQTGFDLGRRIQTEPLTENGDHCIVDFIFASLCCHLILACILKCQTKHFSL